MKFGYFDDTSREYVITQPDTPMPWINYLGSDETLLYSSDYPHWDGAFPNSTRKLAERTDLTDASKRNIFGENARRYYPALAEVPATR